MYFLYYDNMLNIKIKFLFSNITKHSTEKSFHKGNSVKDLYSLTACILKIPGLQNIALWFIYFKY